MAKSSLQISEPKNSPVTRFTYQLRVTGADGQPLPAADVFLQLEGDGSIAPGFSAKEAHRETDANGGLRVTWYRRGIFDRDVKATLSVSCERDDVTLSLEALDPESASQGPWISWTPTRRKY